MYQPKIHYSKASQRQSNARLVLTGLLLLIVFSGALGAFYKESKLEGIAEYKAQCIGHDPDGYLRVTTACQPHYRSK